LALVFVQAHVFHGGEHNVAVIACILITLLLAAVSHRWVETPFLRLKDRVAGEQTPTPQTLAAIT
jgi:peptidoglycan/LPS O-acetylase OafA/YrhL